MRFYTQSHKRFCIDLHARPRYMCNLDADGEVRPHTRRSQRTNGNPTILTPA